MLMLKCNAILSFSLRIAAGMKLIILLILCRVS